MPAQRQQHSSTRDRKPYDRPPPKPANAKKPAADEGGLARSGSLLSNLAKLVVAPFAWLAGDNKDAAGDQRRRQEEDEDAMLVEEEMGGMRAEGSGTARTKRRPSLQRLDDETRRKRQRRASPPRALPYPLVPGGSKPLPVPDLAASLAKKRHPSNLNLPGPPPPLPAQLQQQRYDPRYQQQQQQPATVNERGAYAQAARGESVPAPARYGSPAPSPRFGLTPRTPFARSGSVAPVPVGYGTPMRATHHRLPSVASSRMSLDPAPASNRRQSSQMVWDPDVGLTTAEAVEAARAPLPPFPTRNTAESILRALEGIKTPLSAARAPVLPAARIRVPIPDTVADAHRHHVGSPYERHAPGKRLGAAGGLGRRKMKPTRVTVEDEEDEDMEGEGRVEKGKGKGKQRARDDDDEMEEDAAAPIFTPTPTPPRTTKKPSPRPQPARAGLPAPIPAINIIHPTVVLSNPPSPPALSLTKLAPPDPNATFRVVDYANEPPQRSSLRAGKQSITRTHRPSAGSERAKAEAKKPNVFRMPEEDEDEVEVVEETEEERRKREEKVAREREWFVRPPPVKEGEMEGEKKDGRFVPVLEKKDFFADSLQRFQGKQNENPLASLPMPVPGLPSTSAAPSTSTSTPAPAPPSQVSFSADLTAPKPTLAFGTGPSPFDKLIKPMPTPALGSGPSPFEALVKPLPGAEGEKEAEKEKEKGAADVMAGYSFGAKTLGGGPSPFAAFMKPTPGTASSDPFSAASKSTDSTTTTAAPATTTTSPAPFGFGAAAPNPLLAGFSFGKKADASPAGGSSAAPAFGSAGFGGGFSKPAEQASTSGTTAPAFGGFPKPATTSTTTAPAFGAAAFGGFPKPSEQPATTAPATAAPAFGLFSKPAEQALSIAGADKPAHAPALGTGPSPFAAAISANPALSGFSFGAKPATPAPAATTADADKAAPAPGPFGQAFASFSKPTTPSTPDAPKTGFGGFGGGTGTTTPFGAPPAAKAGGDKPAEAAKPLSLFGAAGNPAPMFGAQAPAPAATTPAPASSFSSFGSVPPTTSNTTTDKEKDTTPTDAPSPEKMDTSPVRDLKDNPLGAAAPAAALAHAVNAFGAKPAVTFGGGFGTPGSGAFGAPSTPFGAPPASTTPFGAPLTTTNAFGAAAAAGTSLFGKADTTTATNNKPSTGFPAAFSSTPPAPPAPSSPANAGNPFNFTFGASTGAFPNPFAKATDGVPAPAFSSSFGFGQPAAPPPTVGAGSPHATPTFTAAAAPGLGVTSPSLPSPATPLSGGAAPALGTSFVTPERPTSSGSNVGFVFGATPPAVSAPAPNAFQFGAPSSAQASPFGATTGLPGATPPLAFGQPPTGTTTPGGTSPLQANAGGLPAPGFNLGAADTDKSGRKVRALPRRKRGN